MTLRGVQMHQSFKFGFAAILVAKGAAGALVKYLAASLLLGRQRCHAQKLDSLAEIRQE
jgi:hypothetical protein